VPHLRLAALLAAATLLAAGCSDDDPQPRLEPTPNASPTESPSTSPTEPSKTPSTPKALNPVQTVRAWVVARNAALANGSTTAVYELSSTQCKSCRDLTEPFAKVYTNGGSIDSRGWLIDSIERRPDFSSNRQVIAAMTFAAGQIIQASGKPPSDFPEEKHILQFDLVQQDSVWLVAEVVFLP
jgi:glucose/arabinose dehydrogenase